MLWALVVIAGLAVLLLATRRRGTQPLLSRQTMRQDRSRSRFLPVATTGRDVERAATEVSRARLGVRTPVRAAPVSPSSPANADLIGVTRRQFFNRSALAMMTVGLSGFGSAVLAFLWPRPSGAFGSKVTAGTIDELLQRIDEAREPLYLAQARTYISRYPSDTLDEARQQYSAAVLPGMEAGIVALYQKCPHLGCRVPFCTTSQWFECPCHGSQYTRVGEKKGGPAPRGMDLFPVLIDGTTVTVDTAVVIQGMPIGTNISGQEAEGPHCVTAGTE